MTTSTPTNEGVAIAATVIAQAKGDVPSARRVLGDAHRWTCTIDPSFKPDDKDKRISELETQVQASGEDREWDAMRADRDDFQAKVAKLTIENANLLRSVDDLTRRVVKIEVERDQAVAAFETEGELVGELQRELAQVKAELAQVRAVNFDAPRTFDPGAVYDRIEAATERDKAHSECELMRSQHIDLQAERNALTKEVAALNKDKSLLMQDVASLQLRLDARSTPVAPEFAAEAIPLVDDEAERQAAYDAAAAGDGVHFGTEPTEAEKAASYQTHPPTELHTAALDLPAPIVVEPAKPAPVSSDPVRPSNVSEGAWASMSPMMRSFAAKRAAAVN